MFHNSHDTSPEPGDAGSTGTPTAGTQHILVVCLAMFGLMAGQQMINPLLAPLAREWGFSELDLGIVMAIGASGVVFASSFWGRRAISWGHRPVLLFSLLVAAIALAGFAVVAQLGLAVRVPAPVLLTLVILTRGVVFGLAWAATPVTAQSYITAATSGESERVRGMSAFGAAQGLGLAIGPAVGGLLSAAGLLVPLYVAPAILLVVAVVVALRLPRRQLGTGHATARRVGFTDVRVRPFLIAGFGLYLALTMVLMTLGFLLEDRLGLAPNQTGSATGVVMLAGAGMIVIVQVVLLPRLSFTPSRLIRIGAVLMTAGMAVLVFASTFIAISLGVALLGAGLGFGMPGVLSGPSLVVSRDEQPSVAGLVSATTGATFVAGPLLGDGLYELGPAAPYTFGLIGLVALVLFTALHPSLRRPPSTRADQGSW